MTPHQLARVVDTFTLNEGQLARLFEAWAGYARKKPLYVRRDVTNATEIIDWAKSNGFDTTLTPDDMHVTCCYSKRALNWDKIEPSYEAVRIGDSKGRTSVALGDKGAVVLMFQSLELQDRFTAFKNAGASWDYEGYTPHITITYRPPEGLDLAKITPYEGPIVLGPEIFEEIDDEFAEEIVEYSGSPLTPSKQPQGERYQRRNYAQLEAALNDLEEQALSSLQVAIEESRDRFLAYVKKSLGPDGPKDRAVWLERLDLKGWGPAQDAFGEMLRQGWEHGRRYARAVSPSIRTLATAASFAPRASLEWLKSKQLYVSGVAKDDLLKRAKGLILQALKTGETEDKTMAKLRRAWSPYVGDEVDPAAMSRLRTIVRTNTTEALNEGIVTESRAMNASRDPAERKVIKALAYVAVLDDRTTEICTLLHGTQIWPDDPRLDALVPPNHFNCRSVLDPVIEDEEYDPDALLSVSKYKQVVALIQPGFGGDKAVNLSHLEDLQ